MAAASAWRTSCQIQFSDSSTGSQNTPIRFCDYFQFLANRFYLPLVLLISFGLPIFVSCYFFGESFSAAYHMNVLRVIFTLHITWSINSFSHIPFSWGGGHKPFEKDILPNDSYIIGILAFGEGKESGNQIVALIN